MLGVLRPGARGRARSARRRVGRKVRYVGYVFVGRHTTYLPGPPLKPAKTPPTYLPGAANRSVRLPLDLSRRHGGTRPSSRPIDAVEQNKSIALADASTDPHGGEHDDSEFSSRPGSGEQHGRAHQVPLGAAHARAHIAPALTTTATSTSTACATPRTPSKAVGPSWPSSGPKDGARSADGASSPAVLSGAPPTAAAPSGAMRPPPAAASVTQ